LFLTGATLNGTCGESPTAIPGRSPSSTGRHRVPTPVTFFVGENGPGKSTLLEIEGPSRPGAYDLESFGGRSLHDPSHGESFVATRSECCASFFREDTAEDPV
jgi:hypothetical protein